MAYFGNKKHKDVEISTKASLFYSIRTVHNRLSDVIANRKLYVTLMKSDDYHYSSFLQSEEFIKLAIYLFSSYFEFCKSLKILQRAMHQNLLILLTWV